MAKRDPVQVPIRGRQDDNGRGGDLRVRRARLAAFALVLVAFACDGKILGLSDSPTPLAQLHVRVTGNIATVRPESQTEPPHLRVALVWGRFRLPDRLCILGYLAYLPDPLGKALKDAVDPQVLAVVAAGCRDPLTVAPAAVGADVALDSDQTAVLPLLTLPDASWMLGPVTARVAYASVVVYDDRNGNGVLDFLPPAPIVERLNPHSTLASFPGGRLPEGMQFDCNFEAVPMDFIYGASTVSLAAPHQQIAYREGDYSGPTLFFTAACAPPPGFSIQTVGGVDVTPVVDPCDGLRFAHSGGACTVASLADGWVDIALQQTEAVRDAACATGYPCLGDKGIETHADGVIDVG